MARIRDDQASNPLKAMRGARRFDPAMFLETAAKGRVISTHPKKQIIFAQGDAADSVFYIKKGKVKVTVLSTQGKEAVVAILGIDEFVGEGCLIGQPKRLATASAMTECLIMRVALHQKELVTEVEGNKFVVYNAAVAVTMEQKIRQASDWSFILPGAFSPHTQENTMDKDRIEGAAEQAKGKVKEVAGKVTGDSKLEGEGKADQVAGKIQKRLAASRIRCAANNRATKGKSLAGCRAFFFSSNFRHRLNDAKHNRTSESGTKSCWTSYLGWTDPRPRKIR